MAVACAASAARPRSAIARKLEQRAELTAYICVQMSLGTLVDCTPVELIMRPFLTALIRHRLKCANVEEWRRPEEWALPIVRKSCILF